MRTASASAPSLEVLPPLALAPVTEQSLQESPSESMQTLGLVGAESLPSGTPSLSSSVSPVLQRPSESVSVPSLEVLPPLALAPVTEQSSQESLSESLQTLGLVEAESLPSTTPSLSSSG